MFSTGGNETSRILSSYAVIGGRLERATSRLGQKVRLVAHGMHSIGENR